jgi:PAS domain S-box-containing protein
MDCNKRIYDILGYNKDEIIGLSILDLIHPKYQHETIKSENGGLLNDNIKQEEFKMIHKNGTVIKVIINSTSVKEKNNGNYSRVWVIEEKETHLEAKKNTTNNGAKTEVYFDILNHDIKNLTQTIMAYSELLLMKPDLCEQYKKYFKTTIQHIRTISDLISNIKQLSYLKDNDIEIKDIDVFKVLIAAIDRVNQDNSHCLLKINQSISESEVIVRSNDMLEIAFFNIINNAIRYEKHQEIAIDIIHSLSGDEKFWKLEFKDNGPGIPDEKKDRVFFDFEFGNEYNHGSGLGLALVKEIILKSGGKVWVEDRIEGDLTMGSNFIFLLEKGK